jgi:hypothetical protein
MWSTIATLTSIAIGFSCLWLMTKAAWTPQQKPDPADSVARTRSRGAHDGKGVTATASRIVPAAAGTAKRFTFARALSWFGALILVYEAITWGPVVGRRTAADHRVPRQVSHFVGSCARLRDRGSDRGCCTVHTRYRLGAAT